MRCCRPRMRPLKPRHCSGRPTIAARPWTPPPPPIGSQWPAGACTPRLWRLRHNHCRSARANARSPSFVSQGLSNRDIADRLVVSTRTVEGHIYRACIKLDVTAREGLSDGDSPGP